MLFARQNPDDDDGIAKQSHDLDSIPVQMPEQGPRPTEAPPTPAWDAYEMGMSLEDMQARWDLANTPEAREALRRDILERSKRRANLAQRSDGVIPIIVAGEPAWHEQGYTMRAEFSAETIKNLALNWEYELVSARDSRGDIIPSLRYVELVETNGNRRPLRGVGVGDKYALVQPESFVDWAARLVDSIQDARFCAAGAVDDFKSIWVQARLPQVLEPIRNDVTLQHLLCVDYFDTTRAQKVMLTADRVVCDNTLRLATTQGVSTFRNRHTTNMRDRMAKYERYLVNCRQAWADFTESADVMVRTQANVGDFAKPILDEVLKVNEATVARAKLMLEKSPDVDDLQKLDTLLEKRQVKVARAIETIREIAASETNTARGTLWGAFQSVTEFANHGLKYQGRDTGKSAFESLLLGGRADTINQLALEAAYALTA